MGKIFSFLSKSNQSARALYNLADATDDLIFSVDVRYRLLAFNESFAHAAYLSSGTYPDKGAEWSESFAAGTCADINERIADALLGKVTEELMWRTWSTQQEAQWTELKCTPVYDKAQIKGVRVCMRNVNKLVQYERQAAFNQDNLIQVLESSENIKIVFKNNKIFFANRNAAGITGYGNAELLKLNFYRLFTLNENDLALRQDEEKHLLTLNTKSGNKLTAGVRFADIKFQNQDCLLATVVHFNEQADTEKEYRLALAALENSHEEIARFDMKGYISYANPAFCKALGYTQAELIGKHTSLIDANFDQSFYNSEIERLKTTGGGFYTFEQKTKDGKCRDVEVFSGYYHEQNDEYLFTFIRDVTDRKNFERRLKKISRSMLSILDRVHAGILIYRDNKPVYVNQALCDILRCKKEDFLKTETNFIHPEDRAKVIEMGSKKSQGEFVPYHLEFRLYDAKGKIKHVHSWNEMIEYDEQASLLTTITDITELKNKEMRILQSLEYEKQMNEELAAREEELTGSEEELRQNLEFQNRLIQEIQNREEFLNEVIDNLPIGFKMFDIEGNLLRINSFQQGIYEKLQINTTKRYNILRSKDAVATGLHLKFLEAVNASPVYDFEYKIASNNNGDEDTYLTETIFPLKSSDNQITSIISLCRDITDNKMAQRAIYESQKRLMLATRSAGMGIWEWNRILDKLVWEDEVYRLFDAQKGDDPIETFRERLYPEDLEKEKKLDTELQNASGSESHSIYRIKTTKGETRYIESFAKAYDDEDVKHAGVIGISRDITHEKMAEQKLMLSEERYRRLVEYAPEAIVVLNPGTGRFTDMNQKACLLFKMSKEDLLQKGPLDLSPVEQPSGLKSAEVAYEKITAVLQGENPVFEWVHLNAEGQEIPVEIWLSRLPTETDEYLVRGSIVDISERKKSEAELRSITKKMAEYKLMALRAVMNPHFVFNSLNSIQYFIAKNDREQAINYLSLFSKLIRKILESSVNTTVSLATELKILEYYLELENLRFENKFEVVFDIDDELDVEFMEVPSLFLQPYAENAVVHGLLNKNSGDGRLLISVARADDGLRCVVEDNGIGRQAAKELKKSSHTSIGMRVTEERLETINQNSDISVTITDLFDKNGAPAGTRVDLFLKHN